MKDIKVNNVEAKIDEIEDTETQSKKASEKYRLLKEKYPTVPFRYKFLVNCKFDDMEDFLFNN